MAFSHNVIYQGQTLLVIDVIATADSDSNYTFAHGLVGTPLIVSIDSLTFQPTSNIASDLYWTITTIDAANITISKGLQAGTGQAAPQIRVSVWLPHSVFK